MSDRPDEKKREPTFDDIHGQISEDMARVIERLKNAPTGFDPADIKFLDLRVDDGEVKRIHLNPPPQEGACFICGIRKPAEGYGSCDQCRSQGKT